MEATEMKRLRPFYLSEALLWALDVRTGRSVPRRATNANDTVLLPYQYSALCNGNSEHTGYKNARPHTSLSSSWPERNHFLSGSCGTSYSRLQEVTLFPAQDLLHSKQNSFQNSNRRSRTYNWHCGWGMRLHNISIFITMQLKGTSPSISINEQECLNLVVWKRLARVHRSR